MQNLTNWLSGQPHNVRWAVYCALIGVVAVIVESFMFFIGVWDWPIILITIIFFLVGSLTLYSDEYWNGPGGD
ncbi:hypothetical protein KJZ63_00920 [Patescibacteria group bacterium]|nr:hypothetical protein [Patescibacteria group bacterium]